MFRRKLIKRPPTKIWPWGEEERERLHCSWQGTGNRLLYAVAGAVTFDVAVAEYVAIATAVAMLVYFFSNSFFQRDACVRFCRRKQTIHSVTH
jgi:hypothetical protein